MKHFEGYPLCAVQTGGNITIFTHNAVIDQQTIFAITDTPEKALSIVNKVNFFDEILEALNDCHAMTTNEEFRVKIGKIITRATGGHL